VCGLASDEVFSKKCRQSEQCRIKYPPVSPALQTNEKKIQKEKKLEKHWPSKTEI
jgi:hypothetical protein